MSIGVPGCPDWACWTMSMHSPRMVLMHSESRSGVANAASLLHAAAHQATSTLDHGFDLRGEFTMRVTAHDTAFGGSFPACCGNDAGTSRRATPMQKSLTP